MALVLDVDLEPKDVAALTSVDAVASFLQRLGYPTGKRMPIPPDAVGLADGERNIRDIQLLSESPDGFLRVLFVQLKSVTAKARADLVRAFGKQSQDYLLILTSDFDALEFVLIDKLPQQRRGPGPELAPKPVAKVFVVPRRWPQSMLRIVRRLTFTLRDEDGQPDGIGQYAKLKSVFDAAHFAGRYYQNRALFADHYLDTRLRDDPAYGENPGPAFAAVTALMKDARERAGGKDEAAARTAVYEPLWKVLGFAAAIDKQKPGDETVAPDYRLADAVTGQPRTVALVYAWERWLDGPDPGDADTPNENPGAAVVTLLERGAADWVIVTNGKLWRLYSRAAHSRSTNFYEVDLEDVLVASGQSDPNEAFRYWWLFFRSQAFAPAADGNGKACWLDRVAAGSRDYAREVEEQLKPRVFYDVVPQLAAGFLEDRRTRLGLRKAPTEAELEEIRAGTLTLLYRILFLLYAESRDLLPVREAGYYRLSLKRLKEEIADAAGIAQSESDENLAAKYTHRKTALYEQLQELFAVMDQGRAAVNVPTYNGGLFRTDPDAAGADERESAVARFLNDRRVPDFFLASAIDRLARVEDPKTFSLAFVDYKSLGVRQLGSIYEGLLEFRLKLADEDLPPVAEKGKRKATSLTKSRGAKRSADTGVKKGEPYLANDKSERKATGSYYTPDNIVEYIVAHTVGPVLHRKLDALRDAFRDAERNYHRWFSNAKSDPRVMLGWRPTKAQATVVGKIAARTEEDFRAFALDKTYDEHRNLVERLFDLKVLDPAMGSGHFLVEAVDFLTDELLHFLNAFPVNPVGAALARTRESILDSLHDQGIETDEALRRQLTDVHLLKRHVLKRCIYGVDLNPLATELAKVSLWLDAFTLGAPLSFLDHHLRPGNSLIGSSVRDLNSVLYDQIFKIDYEPMLRAIRDVLLIARSADATAAEAHRSAELFAHARQALSGYRIVLDVLVAKHFGIPLTESLLTQGRELNMRDRASFVASVRDRDRPAVEQVEALSRRRRFFHWDLEFPEVFFRPKQGVLDSDVSAAARLSQAIEPTPEPDAGFDAIVGNPPYVRQETLKDDKAYLKAAFRQTFDAANDLYVYFMQREIEALKAGGLMSMIVANKWLRAGYGKALRRFLLRYALPQSIVDFGHSPIFPEADTFPCVPIFSRRSESLRESQDVEDGATLTTCMFPRDVYKASISIGPYVKSKRKSVPIRLLRDDGWTLDDPRVQMLMEKIRSSGEHLAKLVGSTPLRGLLTGLNEAFIVDRPTRERLLRDDPNSETLIRPLIRGRDIDRWQARNGDSYLVTIPSSANVRWPWSGKSATAERIFRQTYPAIAAHLSSYREKLIARQDQGQNWWELRSCDYWPAFDQPRIAYQVILYHSVFSLVIEPAVHNDKVFLLPTDDLALLGVLSSPVMWWYLTRSLPHMKDEALATQGFLMGQIPVPLGSGSVCDQLSETVDSLISVTKMFHALEGAVSSEACDLAGLEHADDRVVSWLASPAATFTSRLAKLAGQRVLSGHQMVKAEAIHRRGRARQVELLARQLTLEERLAVLVEDSFSLTGEERQLLRETRPVRDPLDVVRAKMNGQSRVLEAANASD